MNCRRNIHAKTGKGYQTHKYIPTQPLLGDKVDPKGKVKPKTKEEKKESNPKEETGKGEQEHSVEN